jgi:hypothetical protein
MVAYIAEGSILMAMRAGAVYDALREANVSEDKARAAAEEIATVNKDQVDLKGEFAVMKWMLGTIVALQLGTLGTIVAFAINHATFH